MVFPAVEKASAVLIEDFQITSLQIGWAKNLSLIADERNLLDVGFACRKQSKALERKKKKEKEDRQKKTTLFPYASKDF